MNRPGIVTRLSGSKLGAGVLLLGYGCVVLGFFTGHVKWQAAWAAAGAAFRTVGAFGQMRRYNAWTNAWEGMDDSGRPQTGGRRFLSLKFVFFVALVLLALWLIVQPEPGVNQYGVAVILFLAFWMLWGLLLRVHGGIKSRRRAKLEASPVSWVLGKPSSSPSVAYALRNLPEYSARVLHAVVPARDESMVGDDTPLEFEPQRQAASGRPKLTWGQRFAQSALVVLGMYAVGGVWLFISHGGFNRPEQAVAASETPKLKWDSVLPDPKPAEPQQAPLVPDRLTPSPPDKPAETNTGAPDTATGRESFASLAQKLLGNDVSVALWRDPDTGNVWTLRDNGNDVSWQQGEAYCKSLNGGRFALPTLHELREIVSSQGVFKGGVWSNAGDSLFLWTRELSDKDFVGSSQYLVFFRKTGNFEPNPSSDRNGRVVCVAEQ